MKKQITFFLVLAMFSMASFVPLAAAKTTVTAWIYLTGDNAAFMSNLTSEFEAKNPDIDVDLVFVDGYYTAFDKLLVALAGGAGPNLAMVEQSLAYALVKGNGAVDLTPYIENRSEELV